MNYAVTVSRMGVWPPDICLQELASNHPMLLRAKAVVVSDGGKADMIRQVSDEMMSVSELVMTHRYAFQLLSKRVEACTARISVDETCLRATWQLVNKRHELITGLETERGNLAWDAMGKDQVVTTMRLNTDYQVLGGAVRSSEEEAIMVLKQSSCVIQSETSDQPDQLGGIR